METELLPEPKVAAEWRVWAMNVSIEQLAETGNAFYCPYCGALNVHSPLLAERFPETGVATGSCFETQCGVCDVSWAPIDSPIMAECYTHVESKKGFCDTV